METVLAQLGNFRSITLPGTKELVYGCRKDMSRTAISVRVYTSIDTTGESRDVGKDAIRVELYAWINGGPKRVGGSKRVNRVPGWELRLKDRVEKWQELLGPECPQCGAPTVQRARRSDNQKFWGCSDYPNCRGIVPIDENPKT